VSRVTEPRDSLADQAATWVPPWLREPPAHTEPVAEPPVQDEPVAEPPAQDEPVAEPPAHAEPAAEDEAPAQAEPSADDEPAAGTVERATVDGESSSAPVQALPVPQKSTPPPAALALIDEAELRAALEAILLVVDEPVTDAVLAGVLEQPAERVAEALGELSAGYTAQGRGFDLRRAAGGWRLYTRPEYAGYVERFILDGQQVRLTQAALETLAVVAYKQPVTRSRVSAIRGVNCDGVIRTLVARGLIEECGTEPDTGAYLYRTTTLFLEKLGLDTVAELPALAPFLPDDVEEIADGER
jgi:segregation and condensation protein B